MGFLQDIAAGTEEAIRICGVLQQHPDLPACAINPPQDHFCFSVGHPDGKHGVSISCCVWKQYGEYEVALLEDGGLTYDESLDYEDVRRFVSVDELVEEITRLFSQW